MTDSLVRTCAGCGANNRIPWERLADASRCGACRNPLPALDRPVEVDAAAFDRVVRSAPVPVLVDFWAAWCPPCRMAAPLVEKVAARMAGKAIVLEVDTDKEPELATRFGVRGIPNFVVLRNGRVVNQRAGVARTGEMLGWLGQGEAT